MVEQSELSTGLVPAVWTRLPGALPGVVEVSFQAAVAHRLEECGIPTACFGKPHDSAVNDVKDQHAACLRCQLCDAARQQEVGALPAAKELRVDRDLDLSLALGSDV